MGSIGRICFIAALCWLIVACSAETPSTIARIPVTSRPPTSTPPPTNPPPTAPPTTTPTVTPLATPSPTPTETATPTPSPTPTPQPTVTPTAAPPEPVTLAFVGDVMLGRGLGDQIRWGRPEYPFAHVADLLSAPTFSVANFESALGAAGYPQPKAYPFRAPVGAAESLAIAGIDLVSLANNHALDYGVEVLAEGLSLLEAQDVGYVGAGMSEAEARAPYVIDLDGVTVAFLSYVDVPVEWRGFDTENWRAVGDEAGVAWAVPELIREDVAAVRPNVDHVIVLLHAGLEGNVAPSPEQTSSARAAVEAGATLVVGHHAHVLQGVEESESSIIFYGLGNFAFEFDDKPQLSAILNVSLLPDRVVSWSFTPIVIGLDGRPRPADSAESTLIFDQIEYATGLIPTP